MPVDQIALLQAARDLRYWLEIQPPGGLFHPSGVDPRETAEWRSACALLDRAPPDGGSSGTESMT